MLKSVSFSFFQLECPNFAEIVTSSLVQSPQVNYNYQKAFHLWRNHVHSLLVVVINQSGCVTYILLDKHL